MRMAKVRKDVEVRMVARFLRLSGLAGVCGLSALASCSRMGGVGKRDGIRLRRVLRLAMDYTGRLTIHVLRDIVRINRGEIDMRLVETDRVSVQNFSALYRRTVRTLSRWILIPRVCGGLARCRSPDPSRSCGAKDSRTGLVYCL